MSMLWVLGTALLTFVFIILVQVVTGAFLSPLRHFPGPFVAKLSSLWLVLQCRRARRSAAVLKQHQKYGDFVRIAPNHVSIAAPEALKEIYGHRTGFLKGPFYEAFHQVQPVLFNLRDARTHQQRRKILNPAFSLSNMKEFEPEMTKNVLKLKKCFHHVAQHDGGLLDFNKYSNFLAFDVIGDYAFGEPFGFLEKERDHLDLIACIDARGEVLNALGSLDAWMRRIMKYNVFDKFWSNGLHGASTLGSVGREAYFRRKAQNNCRKDLLSFLFDSKDSETNRGLTEDDSIAESISFIVGGSDTTSSTMTHFTDIVSRNPNIQKRLQAELDIAYPDVSDEWVADFVSADKLPFLTAVLRETMRVRPTSSTGLERVTPPGGKVVAGRIIPGGTLVSVPTLGIFNDTRIFKNPEIFDVDRWLQPDSSDLLEYFHPFSVGPRSCIGRNFAWMEMIKTLATLFRTFEFTRLSDNSTELREGFFVKVTECVVWLSRR